jgi:geranylgeranyl pyrophosphate synthase
VSRSVPAISEMPNFLDLSVNLSSYIERTRQGLHVRLCDAPAGDLLCRYFERGKMLRAFMVFAASMSVGGNPEDVVMAAEAVELLHGASLFHDDIIDHASHRRGIISLHELLGVGKALVIGDDLLLRAFAALSEAQACHPAARVLRAMEALNLLAIDCCRGQYEELCAARWIAEEQYSAIIARKTAAPFVAAGVLGVLLGGGNTAQLDQIRCYGQQVGIAFQIDDDLLDLIGEPGALGKPVGNSLAEGRPMLPLIYLRKAPDDAVRRKLDQLEDVGCNRDELIELLEQHGIFDQVLEVRQRHLDSAIATLKSFPNSSGVDALRALACRKFTRASA